MKKLLLWIVILVLSISMIATFSFVGCKKEAEEVAAEEGAVEEEAVEGLVTIKFTYWGSPIEKEAIAANIEKFEEKYSNIKVNAMYIPNEDYITKITAMIAGNDAPDVGYLFETQALAWAEEGKLLNINDFLEKDAELKREDFLGNIWYNWAEGKSLGTNTACEAYGIYYNRELTDAAGVVVPATAEEAWTWDEFVEAAQKLTIDTSGNNALDPAFDYKNIKQYGIQFSTWWGVYMNMVFSNGGDYINEDGTEFTLDDPEAVEAIQKMADLINVYHVAPSPAQVISMPSAVVGLQSNQVAMMIDGQWNLLDLGLANFDFGIGVLPKLKKSITVVLGSPTVIFSSTKYPDESWLLFKWLADPESSIDLHKGGLWMPLMKAWYEDPELIARWAENNPAHPKEYKTAIMNQVLENGVPGIAYYVKGLNDMDAIVSPALDQVWLGEKTAEEALNEVASKAESKLQGTYKNLE